jgi:CRISPR-associated protein Cas1
MKIVITEYGTYLSKVGNRFKLKNKDVMEEYSAKKVEQVLITCPASISTEALELAIDNNIDIIYMKRDKPIGRFWHSKLGSICTIRRKQLELRNNKLGIILVKEWIGQKIEHQISHLKTLLMNRRDERKDIINNILNTMNIQKNNIDIINESIAIEEIRGTIQGHEGTAGKAYFKALSILIPEKYKFDGRSRAPAKDYFNCMLNYGYGMLYHQVEGACIVAGIDPYIGIMHIDNYNRTAFVYDLIEKHRIYVNKSVFKLFSTSKINSSYFDTIEGGYYLNKEGTKVVIEAFNNTMESREKYGKSNKNMKIKNIIKQDCHNIANKILKYNG